MGCTSLASGDDRWVIGVFTLPSLGRRTKDIVTLVGPRRAGKTTLMFQATDAFEASGVPRQAMLHVNLEEPALQPAMGTGLLDEMFRVYREQVYPKGRAHVF